MLNTKLSKTLTINVFVVLFSLSLLALYYVGFSFFRVCNMMLEIDPPLHVTCIEKVEFVSSIGIFLLVLFVNFTSIKNSKTKLEYFINSSPQIILLILLYFALKGWV